MKYPLIENQAEVLQYLRGRFPMYHNSNVFVRDIHDGIRQLLKERGDAVGTGEVEQRAAEFCKALEHQKILVRIDERTWTLNYPPFRTPERKKAPEPPKPAPKPAGTPAPPAVAKPEKPGTP